jgi:hypothetical protein
MKKRLHLYPHNGPQTRAYIVAEPGALRALAQAAEDAARGVLGFETIKFYSSDGHEFELALVCDVSEEEWQQLPVPTDKNSNPAQLTIVQMFDELKQTA